MKPHRDDKPLDDKFMGLSQTDLDFLAAQAKTFDHAQKILSREPLGKIEKTLSTLHIEAALKASLKELRSLIELLGETNRPEAAAYIQVAQDQVEDVLEEFFHA